MNQIILVTGPARSGKSEWAEALAIQSDKPVVYIATASRDPADEEWLQRIQQHQQRRPLDWMTIEVPEQLSDTLAQMPPNTCVLVDSLGTWVANLLSQEEAIWEKTMQEFLETVQLVAADMIFVAEETGWGVVPPYPMGRTFRDRLGGLVRYLGTICEPVYLVTGGHVLNLSLLGSPLFGGRGLGIGDRGLGIGDRGIGDWGSGILQRRRYANGDWGLGIGDRGSGIGE